MAMYGKFNPNLFCRVVERILNERDPNVEYKVTLTDKETDEDSDKKTENKEDKTA